MDTTITLPDQLPLPLTQSADGTIYVGKTRVTLDTVISDYLDGACAVEIVHHFDALRLADVHATLAYYEQNRVAVDEYLLAGRQRQASEIRVSVEDVEFQRTVRERLLARHSKADGAA